MDKVLQDAKNAADEKYNEQNERWSGVVDALFAARAAFEEARLFNEPEDVLQTYRSTFEEASHEYYDLYWQILEYRNQQQREKAETEDMKAVRDDRDEKQEARVDALAQFKTPLDDQKALAEGEKATLNQLKETLTEREGTKNEAVAAWEQRDQAQDGTQVNNDLEAAKNAAV